MRKVVIKVGRNKNITCIFNNACNFFWLGVRQHPMSMATYLTHLFRL